ncbi:VOC family protein [Ornithinimicrobium sp. INDO-MA30-4]|nr:VOC family protein [Ornithinimicrobium sp. INDO-MA30-4]UJH69816.1 VOC family protein [Ornithinimicrobium sp. INDO-MA30-4]
MRIDHVCYAAGPEGLQATARRLADALGVYAHEGGVHPRFGTRNMVLPLADGRYIEVVEVLDHPASDKAPLAKPRALPLSVVAAGLPGWSQLMTCARLRRDWAVKRSPATGIPLKGWS